MRTLAIKDTNSRSQGCPQKRELTVSATQNLQMISIIDLQLICPGYGISRLDLEIGKIRSQGVSDLQGKKLGTSLEMGTENGR